MSAADISSALANYHKAAFTAWDRDNGLWTAIVALEELNALVAWSSRANWQSYRMKVKGAPAC